MGNVIAPVMAAQKNMQVSQVLRTFCLMAEAVNDGSAVGCRGIFRRCGMLRRGL